MTARSSSHDYLSQSTAYIGSYPDGYPSESLLKDRGSPTMTARIHRVLILMATRASQQPIVGLTLTAIPWGVS